MSNESGKKKFQVPIWEKSNLTIEEAAEYSGMESRRQSTGQRRYASCLC